MKTAGEKHKEVESTQTLLKKRLELDPTLPHGYYVMAEVQTAGKGRGDHLWVSAQGNLHGSILLRDLPFSELTWIPLWVSVCLLKALKELGVDDSLIQLKWPNDLWIQKSKKISGILCEKRGEVILVGIGLNLITSPSVGQETGSLSEIAKTPTTENVLEKLLIQLNSPISAIEVRKYYEQHMLFCENDLIEWQRGKENEKCSGSVVGLGAHGELLVQVDDKTIPLYIEDVRAIRLN